MKNEAYLGDNVSATYDGWRIQLTDGGDQKIALEPRVFASLLAYAQSLGGPFEAMVRRTHPDEPTEARLAEWEADPLYWHDKDPVLVAKVREGYRKLYGEPDAAKP